MKKNIELFVLGVRDCMDSANHRWNIIPQRKQYCILCPFVAIHVCPIACSLDFQIRYSENRLETAYKETYPLDFWRVVWPRSFGNSRRSTLFSARTPCMGFFFCVCSCFVGHGGAFSNRKQGPVRPAICRYQHHFRNHLRALSQYAPCDRRRGRLARHNVSDFKGTLWHGKWTHHWRHDLGHLALAHHAPCRLRIWNLVLGRTGNRAAAVLYHHNCNGDPVRLSL